MADAAWSRQFLLREWQEIALNNWIAAGNRGVASVVTGGGKTKFAFACMDWLRASNREARFVIVVPTIALADQWVVGLTEDLGIPRSDVALLGGGERAKGHALVTVMVLNSARSGASEQSRLAPTMLIVDECHRVASPANSRVLSGDFVATLGLSATPQRDWDNLFAEVVEPGLGKVIFRYDYNQARRDGVISPFALVNVAVKMTTEEQRDYDRLSQRLAVATKRDRSGQDSDAIKALLRKRARVSALAGARLPMAIRLVERHRRERAIVFHEDINSANILAGALQARGHRVGTYHSGLAMGFRQDNLRMFRAGEIDVLVTCRALDEGVDVPDARIAIIAASTASVRQRVQRLGRVLRPSPSKQRATVYTIYASKPEEDRLRRESQRLVDLESLEWLKESS